MKIAPPLSVVVAAHNVENEIYILLQSLCASEFRDFEVCLCDDASTDRTVEVVKSFADRLRLRIVSNPSNRGVTHSRNEALQLAAADRVLYLDADVRIYPDTITKLLARFESTGADVLEGIYSDIPIDSGVFSGYYALLVHHSFLGPVGPVAYNVFNGWCALCRTDVMRGLNGHVIVEKGVEVENEMLGRALVEGGFRLLLDPGVAVDHHWRGPRRLLFRFTSRVYWWVKIFFAYDRRFESALTTRNYGLGTLCFPVAVAMTPLVALDPLYAVPALAFFSAFFLSWGPFFVFVFKRRGFYFLMISVLMSCGFSFPIAVSAVWSAVEEFWRKAFHGAYTLETLRGTH